jgi:hypothetical protein
MDTGYRSPGTPAHRRACRTSPLSLPDVTGLLASQQFPGLPSRAAGRISQALAAESVDRATAADRETHTPVRIPRPRTGKELPPLTHVVPRPRQAPAPS